MSGLGGDAFYHVFDAKSGRAIVFNGTGPAPEAATPERYAGGIPRTGPLSVSVPGMLAGLGMMHREYGRLPWAELCAEAARLAREVGLHRPADTLVRLARDATEVLGKLQAAFQSTPPVNVAGDNDQAAAW